LLLTPYTVESVVAPAWSLSYELYFYAVFAFCVGFPGFRRGLLLILFFTVVGKLFLFRRDDFPVLDFFLSSFLFEFLAGVLLFELRNRIMKTWLLHLSVVLMVVFVYLGMGLEEAWGILRVLTWGSAAVCLVLAALILEARGFWLADRWSVLLGNASYTLYLSHTLLLTVFYLSGLRAWCGDTEWAGTLFFTYLLLIVIFSVIFYRLVERPLYLWFRALPERRNKAGKKP
jgi:exopolysaccharide production protein ExoZ